SRGGPGTPTSGVRRRTGPTGTVHGDLIDTGRLPRRREAPVGCADLRSAALISGRLRSARSPRSAPYPPAVPSPPVGDPEQRDVAGPAPPGRTPRCRRGRGRTDGIPTPVGEVRHPGTRVRHPGTRVRHPGTRVRRRQG